MTKVIMHGCNGAMGQVISKLVKETEDIEIIAGIDISQEAKDDYPVYALDQADMLLADVVIDFSVAKAVDGILDYAVAQNMPIVLCTTGLSEAQIARVNDAARMIPVLRSANMSLGINTIFKLAAAAAQVLAENGYDMEIVEKHHNKKLDAPSGTALAIADAINAAMGGKYTYKLDRSSERARRYVNEIGIQAVRGGTIVGEHEVLYCGADEVIEIRHTAYSKAIFAKGALSAAKFLKGKEAGLYTMTDVIG